MSSDWSGFLDNTHTDAQKSMLTPPHSSRVRTFVLAGPQKNADKADIIFGLLRGLCMCVYVQIMCVRVCRAACVRTCMVRSTGVGCGILGVSLTVKLEQK